MKAKKRVGPVTYLKLTFGLAILSGLNYVFNKLLDLTYGKNDIGYATGIGILFLLFIGGFTFYLWIVDRKGTIAQMLGQGADVWRISYQKKGEKLEVAGSTKVEVEELFLTLRTDESDKGEGANGSQARGDNVVELIAKVDDEFSQRKPSMLYTWLTILIVLGIVIFFTELSYQDLGLRFAVAASGLAVVLSIAQLILDRVEYWIADANYGAIRHGRQDLLLYALVAMKARQPTVRLQDVYHRDQSLFEPRALVERLYR
jgi:hypothetical protein